MQATFFGRNIPQRDSENPVYKSIKEMVVRHELPPGKRIKPEPLADQLFVSNTPVREALIRLAAEGIIVDVPKSGFFTKEVSEAETRGLYALHAALVDWIVDEMDTAGGKVGLLKPPKYFATLTSLEPGSAVETLDQLFMHMARQTGNIDVIQIVSNINARTFFVRAQECEQIEGLTEDIVRLCRRYADFDLASLRDELREFHDKRLELLPAIMRMVARARATAIENDPA